MMSFEKPLARGWSAFGDSVSAWRRIAIEKLPQFKEKIEHSESIGMLWIDLLLAFERAHNDPPNEETIRRIYDFAWWAVGEAGNDDVRSATVCAFFEHLPTDSRVRRWMPHYMTREQFRGMEEVFKYFLSPDEHREFVREFLRRRRLVEEAARRRPRHEEA